MAWPDGLPGQEERPRSDSAWARAEHRQRIVLNHHSFTRGQGLLCAEAALPPSPAGTASVPRSTALKGPLSRTIQDASHSPGQPAPPSLCVQVTMDKHPLPLAANPYHGLGNPTRASLAGERELLDLWCRVVAVIVCVKDPPVWSLPKENPEKIKRDLGRSWAQLHLLGDGRSKGPTSDPGYPDRHNTQLMALF